MTQRSFNRHLPVFKELEEPMHKYEAWINKQMKVGILHKTSVTGGASMFVEVKGNARIRTVVDLRFKNNNTQADQTQIPEANTVLNVVARVQF